MPVLSVHKLIKAYHGRRVVDSVDLSVSGGEVAGLLGPNGAGKTTTFYMTVGMIRPDNGGIFIDDIEITSFPMYVRAAKGIGYLPQEPSVFRKMTVYDNIMAILETRDMSRRERKQKADALLTELGIDRLAGSKAAVLSGGERRRLEISRALATDPSFILLDEPFAGIDPLAVIDIQNIIVHLTKKKIGVLISDHNVRETLGVCDKAYILNKGSVICSGTPTEIAASPMAREIYLGDSFSL
ncbi:MAG: LPS export ABC transporter ATP-binding protein [Deltaproteobacteria bacterium]|nr:LPS export ABC transporter ATP-binding protein [Deltaproteobacteria bacterium]